MVEQQRQVGVEITDEMIAAGFAAASEHFFDDTDVSVVTPEALREIYEAMHRLSDQGARRGKCPSLT